MRVLSFRSLTAFALVAGAGCKAIIGYEAPVLDDAGAPSDGGTGGHIATCSNTIKDGNETDVDCGGSCPSSCGEGKGCRTGADCVSHVCSQGTCLAAACTDSVKNGDETDVDCGGSCPKCGAGETCSTADDCISGLCESSTCTSTCSDSIKGGTETDVDCGGSECQPCADGKACDTNADCTSGICTANVCTGEVVWSDRFGGTGSVIAAGLAVDPFGNAALTSALRGSADFGGGMLATDGGSDVVIAKYDPNGGHIWSKRFGGALDQTPRAIASDPFGNVVVTGSLSGTTDFGGGPLTSAGNGDLFVAAFSLASNHLWSRRFGDGQDQFGTAVAVNGSGQVFVTGSFYGSLDFGGTVLTSAGANDIFLVKLSFVGAHLWSKRFGDAGLQSAASIATDDAGDVFVTGAFYGSVDFGGGVLTSAGSTDVFVAKFDGDGKHIWSKRFGGTDSDSGTGVAVDKDGNVVVGGTFRGAVDFGGGDVASAGADDVFVVKLDNMGNHVWSHGFGGPQDESAPMVAVDDANGVILSGSFLSTIDFGGGPLASAGDLDVFVAKLDPGGSYVWSRRFGDGQGQSARAIAAKPGKHVVAAGDFLGSITFGQKQQVASGTRDIYLAELLTP